MSIQSSRHSKLEKADILEMTVKHLRNLQRAQMTGKSHFPPGNQSHDGAFWRTSVPAERVFTHVTDKTSCACVDIQTYIYLVLSSVQLL